ncbi:MAG: cysteine protease StiP family protein [Gemmataceae bacterium]|nr:cysteine protease StiP family protein [Gemmataceae bacterium]
MFTGSYHQDDAVLLLKPVGLADTPVAEKERLIQSGRRHYSEMITRERLPSAQYLRVFREGLDREKSRLARDVIALAALIADRRVGNVTLVSLARAGTPIGVLLARVLRRFHGRTVAHYSISIIRDRGIDETALRYILARHAAGSVVFVDGWTGKGVIAAELERAIGGFNAANKTRLDAGLFAIADLSGTAAAAATTEDYLIPSCILGATVSGLVSRSILNDSVVGPDDFHACLWYREFERDDLSLWFADVMTTELIRVWKEHAAGSRPTGLDEQERRELRQRSADFIADVRRRYGARDVNFVKPGIGEATRVLLRRVPDRLLLRDPQLPEVAHLRVLATEKKVPMVTEPTLPYRAAALIRGLDE